MCGLYHGLLKALRWRAQIKTPDRFKLQPHHLIPGPYKLDTSKYIVALNPEHERRAAEKNDNYLEHAVHNLPKYAEVAV